MVYSFFARIIYLLIILSSLVYIVGSFYFSSENLKFQYSHFLKLFFSSLLCICFFFVFVFSFFSSKDKSFLSPDSLEPYMYEIAYFDFYSLWVSYKIPILIVIFFSVFFIYFPLLYHFFTSSKIMDSYCKKGFLQTFSPSINVVILSLIASSFQPYYIKPNIYFYLDLVIFFGGIVLLLGLLIKKRFLFNFYEMTHILFLVCTIYFVLLNSDSLLQPSCFNVRYIFYLLAFLVWCWEWMFESCVLDR